MNDDDKTIEELEAIFPTLAAKAFRAAYEATLRAGFSVMVAEGNFIVEVFPDGTRRQVKPIKSRTRIDISKPILIP